MVTLYTGVTFLCVEHVCCNCLCQNCVYKAPRFSIESQGLTKVQDQVKDKDSQGH